MPTLRSHTHLQAAQADTQTKACKRVCLPMQRPERIWTVTFLKTKYFDRCVQ